MEPATDAASHPLLPAAYPDFPSSSLISRLNRRLLVLSSTINLVLWINRCSIAFVASDLCAEMGINNALYGFGVAILFAGCALPQLVGNAFLKRLGGPTWFAILLLCSSAAAVGLGYIQTVMEFYLLLGMMGLAMGSAYPGILYYLCTFYPPQYVDAAIAATSAANAFAIPVASLLSTAIVASAKAMGLNGWRSLLIGEGLLPAVLAIVVFFELPVSVAKASFLTPSEKRWLEKETSQDDAQEHPMNFVQELEHVMTNINVQIIACIVLSAFGVSTVLSFFVTLIIRTTLNGSDDKSGTCGTSGGHQMLSMILTAVPFVFSGVSCLMMTRWADRIENRKRFAAVLQSVMGALLILWPSVNDLSFVAGFVILTCAVGCSMLPQAIVFGIAASSSDPAARSMTMSYLNTIYSISGLIFPIVAGKLADGWGYGMTVACAGCCSILAGCAIRCIRDPLKDEVHPFNDSIDGSSV